VRIARCLAWTRRYPRRILATAAGTRHRSSGDFGISGYIGHVPELTDAKRRILDRLKRADTLTAPEVAAAFDLTDTAVRQHLEALEQAGLVERTASRPQGRGRPPVRWRLTPLAHDLFPDRHADLTVELIAAIRESVGEEGLDRIVASRAARQRAAYRKALPDPARSSVKVRVRRLADLRSAEGYLAEAVPDGRDMLLLEHHCPICDAASVCQGLCRAELELFQEALGDDVTVTRTQHVLSGGLRCAYRISPRSAEEPAAQLSA
jgi:predicted ArsR family transcriptional regulator